MWAQVGAFGSTDLKSAQTCTNSFHGVQIATDPMRIFLLITIPHLPIRERFLVLTAPQSPLQEENFDQFVNWQSSWQGIWQTWVKGGKESAYLRHSLMSACPPSCLRQVIAGSRKTKKLLLVISRPFVSKYDS